MEFIKLDVQDSIAIVTLDRPPINSLNVQVYDEINEAFQRINRNRNIKVAILRAEGRVFMAGNDINDFESVTSENYLDYMKHIQDSISAIYNCRVPTIAALSGAAVGAGIVLVASCDIIIASEHAKIGIPEINVGLIGGAEGPSRLLPHKVVRYLALTGDTISATELKHYGGVLDVVSDNELMNRVTKVANKIANKSPLAVEHWKQNLNAIEVYNKVEDDSALRTLSIIDKKDTKEASNAYLEKRSPEFTRG